MNARFRTYSYGVGGAFWVALVVWVALDPSAINGVAKLAPLVAVAVAGEELVIRRREDDGGSALSLSAVAHVAAAVLLTPVTAALAAALGVLIGDGLRRDGHRYLLINSAMFGGSTWVAATVFHGLEGSTMHWTFAAVPALVVLIVVRYLVTSTIFSAGMAALGTGSFVRLVGHATLEEVPAAIGEGSLGVLVAFGLGDNPVLLPFLLPLLAALFFARANLERLRRETQRALQAMADVVDARDPSTTEHSERVAELVARFAAALELPRREAERLVSAARFHDLGKIAVDKRTLSSAERLTEDEVAQIRMHPRLSAKLLRPFSFAREIAEFAALHHERWDGTGYYSVQGDRVPIEAHVLIVADSYDAMTSARPYRPAVTREDAVAELLDKAAAQFHPLVARAFAAILLEQPLRSRLSEGELAELRSSFAHVGVLAAPPLLMLLEPRLIAMSALVATLITAGVPGVPRALVLGLAGMTGTLLCCWAGLQLHLRMRRSRARAALDVEAAPEIVLAAAGFAGWAVYLTLDSGEIEAATGGIPAADVDEVRSWLRLGIASGQQRLSSGAFAVGREGTDHCLVLGLRRRPRAHELELVAWLADEIAQRQPRATQVPARRLDGERALALVELGAFERLRQGAGQLVAERVVAEAERRLRATLRASDAVVRLDHDVLAISIIADGAALDAVEQRLRDAVLEVSLPHRLGRLEPRVVVARAAEAHEIPELAAVEHRLLPSQLPA